MPRTANLRLIDRLTLTRPTTTEYPPTPPIVHADEIDRTLICDHCKTEVFTIRNSNELPHVWAESWCGAPVIEAWSEGEWTNESRLSVGDWNRRNAAVGEGSLT
jgi:hypothetical protein